MERIPDRADRSAAPDELSERQVALHQALSQLPPRMRATLVLRFYDDLSEHQVAEILRCSIGSVKSQTSRGLVRLRAALAAVEQGTDRRSVTRTGGL